MTRKARHDFGLAMMKVASQNIKAAKLNLFLGELGG